MKTFNAVTTLEANKTYWIVSFNSDARVVEDEVEVCSRDIVDSNLAFWLSRFRGDLASGLVFASKEDAYKKAEYMRSINESAFKKIKSLIS